MEKQRRLIALLATQTEQGKLAWGETYASNSFQVSFASSTVKLTQVSEDEAERIEYYVSILDEMGRTIDSFSDEDLTREDPEGRSWFAFMRNLFAGARRIAMGSEKITDDILRELESPSSVYIEPLPKGLAEGAAIEDYAVETSDDRVLRTFKTQREAIDWATSQGHVVHVARVRNTHKSNPGHWRKA